MSSPSVLTERVGRDLRLTRELLDRLPDASMTWRPHTRSFTLSELGTHLARLPHWGAQLLAQDHHDLAASQSRREPAPHRAGILALFDRHVAEWEHVAAAADDVKLESRWELRHGNRVLESLTHAEAIERYLLHHLIHHRGQLTVYLRLLDVPLLPLYGPTADQPRP